MKINEIIVENQQLDELGFKDLAKGFKQGTLGKSIGQGINTAGQKLGKSIVGGGIADKAISAGGKVAKGIDKATDVVARGAKTIGKNIASTVGPVPGGIGNALGQAVANVPGASSLGRVGNRLAKQFVGKDPNQPWLDKDVLPNTVNYSQYSDDFKPEHNGEVYQVKARGKAYFKSYTGRWYEKTSMNPNDYSITHPLDDYKDYEVLDRLLQQGTYNIVNVKKSPTVQNQFIATSTRSANQQNQQDDPESSLVDQNGNPIK